MGFCEMRGNMRLEAGAKAWWLKKGHVEDRRLWSSASGHSTVNAITARVLLMGGVGREKG